ncbi:MAG: hypothetical protein PHS57_07285 [Alphaproteobacteria bacterium]|nr:hypothetical protein [Alphaproteobacteria bacterium]
MINFTSTASIPTYFGSVDMRRVEGCSFHSNENGVVIASKNGEPVARFISPTRGSSHRQHKGSQYQKALGRERPEPGVTEDPSTKFDRKFDNQAGVIRVSGEHNKPSHLRSSGGVKPRGRMRFGGSHNNFNKLDL